MDSVGQALESAEAGNWTTGTAKSLIFSLVCVAGNITSAVKNCNEEPWWEKLLDEIADITEDAVADLSYVFLCLTILKHILVL